MTISFLIDILMGRPHVQMKRKHGHKSGGPCAAGPMQDRLNYAPVQVRQATPQRLQLRKEGKILNRIARLFPKDK